LERFEIKLFFGARLIPGGRSFGAAPLGFRGSAELLEGCRTAPFTPRAGVVRLTGRGWDVAAAGRRAGDAFVFRTLAALAGFLGALIWAGRTRGRIGFAGCAARFATPRAVLPRSTAFVVPFLWAVSAFGRSRLGDRVPRTSLFLCSFRKCPSV